MPGEDVALQEPANEPRVIAKEGGYLIGAARERRHSYWVSGWHLVESVRRPSMDGLMGSLEPGEEASVIKQGRLLAQFLAVDPGRSSTVDGYRSGFGLCHRANVWHHVLASRPALAEKVSQQLGTPADRARDVNTGPQPSPDDDPKWRLTCEVIT
jgi:hypothetical protein